MLLAAHVLRHPAPDTRVTLVERRGQFGQGLAYSTSGNNHVLNVPARGMSAFADDSEHFWRWLRTRGYSGTQSSWVLVPRRLYGAYLESVLAEAGQNRQGRLVLLWEDAMALHEIRSGTETVLATAPVSPAIMSCSL